MLCHFYLCSEEIVYAVAEAISYEVRAHWNGNRRQGKYTTFSGLSCFSPVINIMRHPLWGRNQVIVDFKFAMELLCVYFCLAIRFEEEPIKFGGLLNLSDYCCKIFH
jgi:hypothetical protein